MRLHLQSRNSQTPTIPVAPLIDIVFITLIFFMTLSVFYQLENEISISVPKADQSTEATRSPGEIIINIDQKGQIVVNQKSLTKSDLEKMLLRLSNLYPNQPVIIRADKKTHHEKVIDVLNACAGAKIWNIAFATLPEEK
jgi:biopolymer transport protein ExbD